MRQFLVLWLTLTFSQVTFGAIFKIRTGASTAKFNAKITFSQFEGKSKGLRGQVEIDDVKKRIMKGKITLPVKSIKTGLSLRDKHMYTKYLKAKKFKNISFILAPQSYNLKKPFSLKGQWMIHGIKKIKNIPIEVSKVKFGANKKLREMRIKSKFDLDIRDFKIKPPKYLAVKMEPVIKMSLDIHLTLSK